MPEYRVQTAKSAFPKPGDWKTVLETNDRQEARAALRGARAVFWRRLVRDGTVILALTNIKPRITGVGKGRWQVTYFSPEGIGGVHWPAGPWDVVYAQVLRGLHERAARHGVLSLAMHHPARRAGDDETGCRRR
ncbi:hypothetical protein AB0M58_13680 [Streptomyces bobili]|uniref:hypothetical protein n=1 Tax=Streptomyces bobili TaxID=67280 RepID=UPI00341D8778